ncbi:MAG TPA: hypothetical protein VN842_05745, partial [Thermoplasmata archaeon]|nr:hypothetical protein [Thermoplasmata archaeon]
ILDPANNYWSTFSTVALSYAPSTIGGPGFADFVSSHALVFSWVVALVTGYLALALTFGLTTRIACFLGSFFSAVLLATQFGVTFFFPGGTDVGEHPLYILIYLGLLLGSAGSSFSVDGWLRETLTRQRLARPAPTPAPRRGPSPWSTAISARTLFVWFTTGTLISLAVGFGLVIAIPAAPPPQPALPTGPIAYVNLSININPVNGWPQYSPANFSVPAGLVEFTIVDNDSPVSWSGCPCPVGGTIGGVEYINGTPVGRVPATNVAHTFNIPALGLQALTPGQSTVQFTIDVLHTGQYTWYCFAPCGTGANPYNTPPMGTTGYMTGTMTVT